MLADTPLATDEKRECQAKNRGALLTRDMGAGVELGQHLWVHGDHDLLLFRHRCIPVLDLLADPLLEAVSEHGGTDIHEPLLRDLRDIDLVGEVLLDPWVLRREGQDLLDGEVAVLRDVDGLDVVDVDVALALAQDVLEL